MTANGQGGHSRNSIVTLPDLISAALNPPGDPECEEESQKFALGELYLFRRRHPRILSRETEPVNRGCPLVPWGRV